MSFLSELWLFLKTRKKLWLLPIVVLLVLFGALLLLAQSSAIAPFIYSIF
jgi:drug/metabolite transporter superfamily protein YnfA